MMSHIVMPVQIKVEIKNLEKITGAFSKYPEKVAPYLRNAAMESAFAVERRAKILSPVDTGRMRASIATSLGIATRGLSSVVSTNVNYAIFVHEGTRRMRARPFMRQGAEAATENIQTIYEKQITLALKDIANMAQ